MKKKLISLLVVTMLLVTTSMSAFADYTQLNLKGFMMDKKTGKSTSLNLYDPQRRLTLSFHFVGTAEDLVSYKGKAVQYWYDYTNDYLFIKDMASETVLFYEPDVNEAYFTVTEEILEFNPEASYKDWLYDPTTRELIYIGDVAEIE